MESRHQISDVIVVDFYESGKLTGEIIAIKFTDYGKVLYDIRIRPFASEKNNKEFTQILLNIDSYFVKTEYDIILENE